MISPGVAARKLRTLVRAGPTAQVLVAEAALRLLEARVTLTARPFARIAGSLGDFVAPDAAEVIRRRMERDPEAQRIARQVGWAIRATAVFMPFRAACLQQAVAAHAMLRLRGVASIVHFGMDRRGDPCAAHVWVEAAGVRMTGYPIDSHMVEIGCFV